MIDYCHLLLPLIESARHNQRGSVSDEKEIEQIRAEEQAGKGKLQREATAHKRKIKLFAKRMKEVKKLKDRAGFERLLELQNVKRGSDAWNDLWRYFYSDEI